MNQQRPSCLLIAALVILVAVGLGALILAVVPRTRPADVEPTPSPIIVVVDPTHPVALPPTGTPPPTPTENILRPTSTNVPPTAPPKPTSTATPAPPTPTAPIQKG